MRCGKCAAELKLNWTFCGGCGAPVPSGWPVSGTPRAVKVGSLAVAVQSEPAPSVRTPTLVRNAERGNILAGDILSHWYKLFPDLQTSSLDFYSSVENAIERRQIPAASTNRVDWYEGGVFSDRREYLRVSRDRLIFDVCAAPFGTGFFVSWWLVMRKSQGLAVAIGLVLATFVATFFLMDKMGFFQGLFLGALGGFIAFLMVLGVTRDTNYDIEDVIVVLPLIGRLYVRFFRPATYYKTDTTLMFMSATHDAVLEVIDSLTEAKGIRGLTELERRPVLKEFFSNR